MKKGEGMDKMLEAYLAAVAAQLPPEKRDDIVAELKDDILTRVEVREEEIGRQLTPDEFEQMLREVGHPLVVAARYAEGPQGIVGAELYPWWKFCMRVALIAVAGVTVLGVALDVLGGRLDAAEVISGAFHQAVSGVVMALGIVTGAGWVIERLDRKPQFLTHWRVKDLGMFEWPATFGDVDVKAFGKALNNGSIGAGPKGPAAGKGTHDGFSPVAGAAASAVFTTIILAWWLGAFGAKGPGGRVIYQSADYFPLLGQTYELLYWPFAVFLMARIVFDALRVVTGSPIRLTAAGDAVLAVVMAGFLFWVWAWSPLAPELWIKDMGDLARLMQREAWQSDPVGGLLSAIVLFGIVTEVLRVIGAVQRLVTGKDKRQPQV